MDNSHVLIPEAFFVLAHRLVGKRLIKRKALKVGLAGAVLTTLIAQRRAFLVNANNGSQGF